MITIRGIVGYGCSQVAERKAIAKEMCLSLNKRHVLSSALKRSFCILPTRILPYVLNTKDPFRSAIDNRVVVFMPLIEDPNHLV